jgi:hypothetical protein
LPPADAPGTAVPRADSNPARWSLVTHASTPVVLRWHVTDVPGWHVTIDGRPLKLESLVLALVPASALAVATDMSCSCSVA